MSISIWKKFYTEIKSPTKNSEPFFLLKQITCFKPFFDYGEYDLDAPYSKIKDWDLEPTLFPITNPVLKSDNSVCVNAFCFFISSMNCPEDQH